MRTSALLILGFFTFLAGPSCAQEVQGSNGLSIRCKDFTKQPDGGWKAGADATLAYPNRPGSFRGRTFYADGMIVNGNDIGAFLDANCANGKPEEPDDQ